MSRACIALTLAVASSINLCMSRQVIAQVSLDLNHHVNPKSVSLASGSPLTLQAAISAALLSSPTLVLAGQQLAQAQAIRDEAFSQKRIQVSFSSSPSANSAAVIQPPPSSETFGAVQNSIILTLPISHRLSLQGEQAQLAYLASESQYASSQYTLTVASINAYYDVLRKLALQAAASDSLTQSLRSLDDTRKRNNAGDVSKLEVLQAQVPVDTAQGVLEQAQLATSIAYQTLNDLMGNSLDNRPILDDPITAPVSPAFTIQQASERALASSVDMKAAEWSVMANQRGTEAARLYQEPALSIQLGDARSGDQTGFSREDSVQAVITLPISDGGLGRAHVRETQEVLNQSQSQVKIVKRSVLRAVNVAYMTAISTLSQVDTMKSAQDTAQITYDKTLIGYENGLFPLINVLNSQSALLQARVAYVQTLYDALTASALLQLQVGNQGSVSSTP